MKHPVPHPASRRALCLLLCLLLLAPTTAALAAEGDPDASAMETADQLVRFIDISLIVKEHNLQLENNELALLNTISNDKLGDAQAALAASVNGMNQAGVELGKIDPRLGSIFSGNAAAAMQQAVSMNPTPMQVDLLRMQLEQAGLQIQMGAESLYFSMVQAQDTLLKIRRSRPLAEQALLLAQTAHSVGMGTEAEALQAKLVLSDLDASISALALGEVTMTYELNKLMGRPFDTALVLAPLPEPELAYYEDIDLAADLVAVVKANFSLRALQRERENIGSDDYNATAREKRMKDNEIEMQTQALRAALTLLYHTIGDDQVGLANERTRLELAQFTADTAETSFAAGQISEMELRQAREALEAQQDAVRVAEQTLFWNIRRYQWAMAGLPISASDQRAGA